MKPFTKPFQNIFEQLRDPLLVVDVTGKIHSANFAAKTSLDLGEGSDLRDVVSLEKSFTFEAGMVLPLLKKKSAIVSRRLKDHDGNESDVVVDVLDLEKGKGESRLKLIHIKDFSSFKNYERWKDEMISMAAHEIKNPLAAIKNSMNILISQAPGPVTNDQDRFLTTSIRSIDRLTRLLDTFLDVSRIQTGGYTLEPRWIDVREFLNDVVESFRTLFNIRQHKIVFTVSNDIERIFVDAAKLEQVLINLLSNAIKFSPADSEIEVHIESSGLEAMRDDLRILSWGGIADLKFARIVVKDSGIGMSEETAGHLFTRYYGSAGQPNIRGSHLGLSISKSLIEVHNGKLDVESELGVGTKVIVSIPQDEETALILSRIKVIENCVGQVINTRRRGRLFTLQKADRRSWISLVQGWDPSPIIRMADDGAVRSGVYFWPLNSNLAVTLVIDADDTTNLDSPFGADVVEAGGAVHPTDDYRIGCVEIPKDGSTVAALFNLALKRSKLPERTAVET